MKVIPHFARVFVNASSLPVFNVKVFLGFFVFGCGVQFYFIVRWFLFVVSIVCGL